jgi:transposase-like protein
MTKEERVSYWHSLIEQQESSGLSVLDFCRENHRSPYQFYRWRRRFRQKGREENSAGFLELVPRPARTLRSGVRIMVGDTLCIEVERGFDPAALRTVIKVLDVK